MKTNRILSILTLVVLLAACSKKDEPVPAPDLAAKVAGTYQVTKATLGAQTLNLPQPGRSATLKLEKVGSSLTQVNFTATTTVNAIVTTSIVEILDLSVSGNDIDLAQKGAKTGTWSNNVISITTTTGGQNLFYTASK